MSVSSVEAQRQSRLLSHLLRRPIGVMMSLTLVVLVGLIAYARMPLQLLPEGFSPPFMWVAVPTLAASPEENELLVAKPLEDALSTLGEIDRLRTFIRTNNVGFAINLHAKSDPDLSYLRIRSRLRRHLPSLPEGSQFARIWRHDPNDDPLYILSVTFPPTHQRPAQVIKDHIVQELERISGVSRVELRGVEELAVRIKLNPHALREARIDAQQLIDQLAQDHFTLTAGRIIEGDRQVWINASSRFESIEAVRARPITRHLTLGEVAEVSLAPSGTPEIQRVNGQDAAQLIIYKVSTENTIEVSDQIKATLARLFTQKSQLRGFERIEFFSQGEFIKTSLDQIKNSALFGGIIALLCLWLFLRSIRVTLMITAAIPLCLLMTIALLYLNGQSLNVLSMMGIILSVGMVIDNAIVVLEQVARLRRRGDTPYQAALEGTSAVGMAITLATATTLVVFLPIMMLSDQPLVGFFITSIGEPVCYALSASLLVALVHLPTASLWFSGSLSSPRQEHKEEVVEGVAGSNDAEEALEKSSYYRVLSWVLEHRLAVSLFTLLFFMSVGWPANQLKRVDKGGGAFKTLTVHLIGPLNGSQRRLDELARRVERQLLGSKSELDIKTIVTSRGWSPEHLKVELHLTSTDLRQLTKNVREERILALLPQRPGYKLRLRRGMGAQNDGVQISVYGPYLHTTQPIAEDLMRRLKRAPEIKEVELDLPEGGLELLLNVNPIFAATQQLSPRWISGSVNAELQERPIGELLTASGDVELLISPESESLTVDTVARTVPRSPLAQGNTSTDTTGLGDQTIDSVVRRSLKLGSGKIRRKRRRVEVNLSVIGEDGEVMAALERELPRFQTPVGYGIDYGERFKERTSNERGGLLAILAGVALVFCLMGLLFESLLTPLAILGTIPLAFVGAIWMLWLCGTSFEVMAMIGGVILVGVVVNNGIVLIDQVQTLRRLGRTRNKAVLVASSTRLRPILMTALTTIGGLIPMAFGGGESVGVDYRPLGQVVIGGLLTSTLLTLVVIPLLYTLIDDVSYAPREARAWIKYLSSRLRSLIPK